MVGMAEVVTLIMKREDGTEDIREMYSDNPRVKLLTDLGFKVKREERNAGKSKGKESEGGDETADQSGAD